MHLIFLLLFGSPNRHALESDGGTTVRTPKLTQLAEKAVSFGASICTAQREARVATVRAAAGASGTEPVTAPPLRPGA